VPKVIGRVEQRPHTSLNFSSRSESHSSVDTYNPACTSTYIGEVQLVGFHYLE